jgi:hypothetical protein
MISDTVGRLGRCQSAIGNAPPELVGDGGKLYVEYQRRFRTTLMITESVGRF